jgi:hypothetical protein
MATDPTAGPRTRRAVLAGAVASVAVLAADRLARPEVTEAASTAVMSEAINSTAAETDIYSSATDGTSALRRLSSPVRHLGVRITEVAPPSSRAG